MLGQIRPGVPVWRTGPESRFPGIPYVIFPGNVGEAVSYTHLDRPSDQGAHAEGRGGVHRQHSLLDLAQRRGARRIEHGPAHGAHVQR